VGNEPYCYLEVKDKRLLKDKMLGVCAIDLDELNTEGKYQRWYELYNKQSPVGEILIEVKKAPEMDQLTQMNRLINQETTTRQSFGNNEGLIGEIRPPQRGHMTGLSMELEEMNKRIDFMIKRTKELEAKAKGVQYSQASSDFRTSLDYSGREGVPYMPEISGVRAADRRFSEDSDLLKRENVKRSYQSMTGTKLGREEQMIKENYPYPITLKYQNSPAKELKDKFVEGLSQIKERSTFSGRKETFGEDQEASKGLKVKALEGVEKLAQTSIEKLQHVENWAERKIGRERLNQGELSNTGGSYNEQYLGYSRPVMISKEAQTEITFHPQRDLSQKNMNKLFSQTNEEDYHKANLDIMLRKAEKEVSKSRSSSSESSSEEEGETRIRETESREREERLRKREEKKLARREAKKHQKTTDSLKQKITGKLESEEKVEYETEQFPQESIYNFGKNDERLKMSVNDASEEGKTAGFFGNIKEKVKEGVEKVKEGVEKVKNIFPEREEKSQNADTSQSSKTNLLESTKEKIEESVNWAKNLGKGSHNKNDVEITDEPYILTPSKPEEMPLKSSFNTSASPNFDRREGVITIPIVSNMRSPGGGEAFEELKKRYIPNEISIANEPRFNQVLNELTSLPMSFLYENQLEQAPIEKPVNELCIPEEALEREEEQEMMEKLEVLGEIVNAVEEMGLLESEEKRDEEIAEEVMEKLEVLGEIANATQDVNLLEAVEEAQERVIDQEIMRNAEALKEIGNLTGDVDLLEAVEVAQERELERRIIEEVEDLQERALEQEIVRNAEALKEIGNLTGDVDLLEAVEVAQEKELEREIIEEAEDLERIANAVQEEILEENENAVINDYQIEKFTEESPEGETVTIKEEYNILRPVENLLNQNTGEMEEVNVCIQETITTTKHMLNAQDMDRENYEMMENDEDKENVRPQTHKDYNEKTTEAYPRTQWVHRDNNYHYENDRGESLL